MAKQSISISGPEQNLCKMFFALTLPTVVASTLDPFLLPNKCGNGDTHGS